MDDPRIVSIEWARLESVRPRTAGSNARLGEHGRAIGLPIARLTTDDGLSGFGLARVSGPDELSPLLGQRLSRLFVHREGRPAAVETEWRAVEFPLWDLAGRLTGLPVYRLALAVPLPADRPLRVPCYDTSLYIDDLQLPDDQAAAELIASEARFGWDRGHRAFKIKVGRGARHMPLEAGTRRDVAVVRAVRAAVGPDAPIMLDANNGWNLNLAKRVLEETCDCRIHWLEEPFHEDAVLYRELRTWMNARGLETLIADGEGAAHPRLTEWAQEGLVDVVQYDIFSHGFTRWLVTARQLDAWNVRSAPHHYGAHVGNFVSCHLAPAVSGFTFVEWDEASTPALDSSAYTVEDGMVSVPNAPGFGLALDESAFTAAVANGGFRLVLRG